MSVSYIVGLKVTGKVREEKRVRNCACRTSYYGDGFCPGCGKARFRTEIVGIEGFDEAFCKRVGLRLIGTAEEDDWFVGWAVKVGDEGPRSALLDSPTTPLRRSWKIFSPLASGMKRCSAMVIS